MSDRTAADTGTVPPGHAVVDAGLLRRLLDSYDALTDVTDDDPDGANTAARALRTQLPDPDVDLVDAMCEAWVCDHWGLHYSGPTREKYRERMREVHALLRDRGECFHPDHQGDGWEPSNEAVRDVVNSDRERATAVERPEITVADVVDVLHVYRRLIDQHRETEQP